ncbi:MAG: hypothetical protein ACFFDW_16375, partial [Candidatus Thorarchaeota archaeon]
MVYSRNGNDENLKSSMKTDKIITISKKLFTISLSIIILSYVYLLFRRWILLTDGALRTFGSGDFIRNYELLRGFTIFFDVIQFIAILVLTISFCLLINIISIKQRKNLLTLAILFGIIFVVSLGRIIRIHLDNLDVVLLGTINPSSYNIYDYAFFIYSTDSLRIVIAILLAVSLIIFNKILSSKSMTEQKIHVWIPVFVSSTVVLYSIIVIISAILFNDSSDLRNIVFYYLHYGSQSLLQIAHIIAYAGFLSKEKTF